MAKRRATLSDEEADRCIDERNKGDDEYQNDERHHWRRDHQKLDWLMFRKSPEKTAMAELLNDRLPTVLLNNHPNLLPNLHFTANWTQLVRAYAGSQCLPIDHDLLHLIHSIDHDLLHLIHSIRLLQLDRSPIHIHPLNLPSLHGMSPKKAHEVSRMASYILDLLQINNIHTSHIRIVDIGAGQACRFPSSYPFYLKIS